MPYLERDLVDDSLHDGVFKLRTHREHRFLNHQQAHELLFAVHQEMRTERATPSETAGGPSRIGLNWIEHHFDTQTKSHSSGSERSIVFVEIANVIRRHQIDGARTKQPHPVPHAAMRKHFRK